MAGETKPLIVITGAVVDSVYVHRAWVQNGLGKMSFPLIGDVGKALSGGFGILDSQGVALRATFIINPGGIIESASANALNVGRAPSETLRLVAAFQSGELTGCDWQPGQEFVVAAWRDIREVPASVVSRRPGRHALQQRRQNPVHRR